MSTYSFWQSQEMRDRLLFSFAGFAAIGPGKYVPGYGGVLIPFWSALLLSASAPALWLWHQVRHKRCVRRGHCPACGYDLRATPGRCPECGTIAATE